MLRDLRFGWRSLKSNPAFFAVAVATLALCIGANSAIFTLVDKMLLRPLPYPNADRLVILYEWDTRNPHSTMSISVPCYNDYKAASHFELSAIYREESFSFVAPGQRPVSVRATLVSPDFFRTLGVAPVLGRDFTAEEHTPGGPKAALVSEHFWKARFGGDQDALGKSLLLDAVPYTIVGVVPDDYPYVHAPVEMWVPLASNAGAVEAAEHRGHHFLRGIGLLKEADQAPVQAELDTIGARLAVDFKDNNEFTRGKVAGLADFRNRERKAGYWLLFAAVGVVLIIGCANLANLLQARGAARQRELALRMSIGASRGRIVRQLLTESVLLAGIGGGAGLFVGWWLLDALLAMAPSDLQTTTRVSYSAMTLLFGLGASFLAAMLFGALPALTSTSMAAQDTKSSASKQKRAFQRGLILAQLVLALVLTFSAAMVLQAFREQQRLDPGFQPDGVIVAPIVLPSGRYAEKGKAQAFFRSLFSQLKDTPEMGEVALMSTVPFTRNANSWSATVDGKELPPQGLQPLGIMITENLFAVLRQDLRAGRALSPGHKEVVVNEAFARLMWPEDPMRAPIGGVIRADNEPYTIVGIVRDAAMFDLGEKPQPAMYHDAASWDFESYEVVMRPADRASALAALRRWVESLDATLAVGETAVLSELVKKSMAPQRFLLQLLSGFSLLALLLSAVGIYGVTAYNVSQRTRELGIRIALGASPRDIHGLMLGEMGRMLLVGLTAGGVGAFFIERLLRTAVERVEFQAGWLLATAALLACLTALATYLPTRRALRIDPQTALRSE